MKKLMLLGGSRYAIPVIEAAHKLGLYVITCDYLPDNIKRPKKEDRIQELMIPLDYTNADWLCRAVQDTADARRK